MKRILLAALALAGCHQVESTERGVRSTYGKIDPEVVEPGLVIYNPWSTDIDMMPVSQTKWTGKTPAYTKDLQTAYVAFAINYHLNPTKVVWMATHVAKKGWADTLIPQAVLQAIKNEIGREDSVELIAHRQDATSRIEAAITTKLAASGIVVDGFDVTNIDYDDAYEKAIEAKQVAVQDAITAQNHTVEVTERAKQTLITAEGEAKAMKVKADALASSPKLVEWEAVQKWNGTLPSTMTGVVPFIHVGGQ